MTKDEFAEVLRQEGFDARNENGTVMVYLSPDDYWSRKVWRDITDIARLRRFDSSIGKILKR